MHFTRGSEAEFYSVNQFNVIELKHSVLTLKQMTFFIVSAGFFILLKYKLH